jgi:hypothetical protein
MDSSAWLEYFADGPNATVIATPIETTRSLLVPSLSLHEVFKRICQQRDGDESGHWNVRIALCTVLVCLKHFSSNSDW